MCVLSIQVLPFGKAVGTVSRSPINQAYWSACWCFCETHLAVTSRSLIRISAWNHQVANPSQITEGMRLCSKNLYINHLPGALWNQADEGRTERKTVISHNIQEGYLEKTHLENITVADSMQRGPITKEQAIWQIRVCSTRDEGTILYNCSNSTKYSCLSHWQSPVQVVLKVYGSIF